MHAPSGLADEASDFRTPGERDGRHARVLHQRFPHHFAAAVHQLNRTRGHAGFEKYLYEQVRRIRYILRRLPHHRVTAQQSREYLPAGHRDREVEWRDDAADPDGSPHRHSPFLRKLGGHGVAEQSSTLRGRIVSGVDRLLDIATGLLQNLTHLPGHRPSELLLALREEIRRLLQGESTLRGRDFAPGLESALGHLDRAIDVLARRFRPQSDHVRPAGRVTILHVRTTRGRHPLPAHEIRELLGH